ncbi:LAFA_0C08614g1_1 [Lachancea sp. 'fantastica']|nr:LAFA_0C08614g1_1 [Lachancea sp. 'fantastica']
MILAEGVVTHRTTVEELLNDKAFEAGNNPAEDDPVSEQPYVLCLNDFIKGDHKQCLEDMLYRGLLSCEVLSNDYKVWQLFVSACQDVDFHVLGTSVMQVVRTHFAISEFSAVEQRLIDVTPTERITGLLAFLRCSCKIAELDNSSMAIKSLAKQTKTTIVNVSKVTHNLEEARQLRDLIIFYLISVQSHGLQCRSPKALFLALCDENPSLRVALQQEASPGGTLEDSIIQELDANAEKKKSGSLHSPNQLGRRKTKTMTTKNEEDKSIGLQPKTKSQTTPRSTVRAQKPQAQFSFSLPRLVSFRRSLVNLSRHLLNKNIAPIVLLVLLFVLKKSQLLAQLARKIPNLFKRLVALLNILMSI